MNLSAMLGGRAGTLHAVMRKKPAKLLFCISLAIMPMLLFGYSQPDSALITLELQKAPIEKAFEAIKKQSSFRVIYDNDLVKRANPVSLTANKLPVRQLLDMLFKNQPFSYNIVDETIIVIPLKKMQATESSPITNADTTISGIITASDTKQPLAGATLTIEESKVIATTDNEGRYSLEVPASGATVAVSFVGYQTRVFTITSNAHMPLRIMLERVDKEMEQVTVVSTGYESLPNERVTGSFAQIDSKLLNQQVGANIIDRLKGVASSILFDTKNDGPSFTIRGLSTINGPKEPLIILDNYPYDGDVNNINPNDIENITILKDAAAASIWGTRAGNGVVVITTKKGKFNQPLKVEFNSNIMVTQKPDLFYLPQVSSADYIEVEEMLFNNGFYNNQINSLYHTALSPVVEVLLKQQQGMISEQEAASQLNVLKAVDIRNEYNKYFYRNAINQQYSLNLQGGSANLSYIVSAGYDRGLSNIDASYSRINLRLDNTYRPAERLQLNFGLLYANSSSASGKPKYGDITIGAKPIPYLTFANASGNFQSIPKTYRQFYTDTAGLGKLLDWNYYPLEEYKHNTGKTDLIDLLGKLGLNYRLMPGIDIDIKYQYQRQQTTTTTLASLESYYTRDLINTYTDLDYSTGSVKYGIPLGGIFGKAVSTLEAQNIRGQVNFNKKFGEHEIVSLIGSEIRQTKINTDNLSAFGYDPDLLITGTVDIANPHLNFVTGSYDYLNNGGVSFSAKKNRFVSFFGNASYIFRRKYTLSGSLRKDASNLFGKATNDKWTPLWSAGAGWNISNEAFYKSTLLPELKLRATYGYSGNVDQSKSAVTVMFYSGNGSFTNLPYGVVTQYKNSELRWERVGMFNIGLDFSFKNRIVSGSIEYYRKKGIDLFGPSPIDYTAGLGYFSIVKNIADMKASGFDITLVSNNISSRSFYWSTNFLLSYNLAKTDKYYLGTGISSSSFVNSGNSITPIPGQPLYTLISYQSGGLDIEGNPQGYINKQLSTDYNSITNDTMKNNLSYDGTSVPKYFGSLINNFSWKRLTININISYKLGYSFRRSYLSYDLLFNNGVGNMEYANRWKQPGDELITNVPALIYPNDSRRDNFYGQSEATIEKGSHIRLQYVNIIYRFLTKKGSSRSLIKGCEAYLNLSNLGILWRANNRKIDPDFPASVPIQKSYSIGIRTNL